MKILHLEDSPSDAELTRFNLREEWPACEIQNVSTRVEFEGALGAGRPDVILSDFTLPSYDGLEALRLARSVAPAVPFIFLSGTIGEERAVEARRQGAFDCLIKDQPMLLVPTVQRALRDGQVTGERRTGEKN
jgi:DNA-binding NtrC family response regulator